MKGDENIHGTDEVPKNLGILEEEHFNNVGLSRELLACLIPAPRQSQDRQSGNRRPQ